MPFINYKTDSTLQDVITHWWNDQFTKPPNIGMEVDRLATNKAMVKNDFGFAIVPEICLEKSDHLYWARYPGKTARL